MSMTDKALEWPPQLDAVHAAPDHHKLLFENEKVRVLETRIEPGETVPIHTHQWPATYYILSWNDFVRRDVEGNVIVDSRITPVAIEPGTAIWAQPLPPHSLENVGTGPIHIISTEVKGG